MVQRIAVFIGQLTQEYQKETLNAMVDAAEKTGYKLDIFTEFGCYGNNYLHADGERNIINLPYVEDYVGVIIMPDTFAVRDMEKQLDKVEEGDVRWQSVVGDYYNNYLKDELAKALYYGILEYLKDRKGMDTKSTLTSAKG